MKKLLAILLCVAMACSLVACGGGNSSSGGTVDTGNFQAHEGLPEGEIKLLVHLQESNPSIEDVTTE